MKPPSVSSIVALKNQSPTRQRHSQAEDDEHLVSLWLRGKSPNSQEAYSRDILQFVDYVDLPFGHIKIQNLHDWAGHLEHLGLADSTRARKLAAVKSLLTFGHKVGYLRFNVGAAVSLPKVADKLSERILTEDQAHRILAVHASLRNRVLLQLFYASGARVSELSGLQWSAVQIRKRSSSTSGQITLLGKGHKTRSILLPATTWDSLQELRRAELEKEYGRDTDPVFRSRKGRALSRRQIWKIVRDAAAAAGISKAVSPHWLRHAHASHALDHGAPTHLVKETLGHKSLATTSRYSHARPDESSGEYLDI